MTGGMGELYSILCEISWEFFYFATRAFIIEDDLVKKKIDRRMNLAALSLFKSSLNGDGWVRITF